MKTLPEGKMARGWRLTKVAWALVRRNPTMLAIAMLGTAFSLMGTAATFYFSGWFASPDHAEARLALASAISLYPMTFAGVFFNVALAGAAAAAFDGRPIGVREALAISTDRIGLIARWALLAAGVGFVLDQIAERIPGAGRLASWLLDAAWSLATIFAVPLLALEGTGPFDTAKGSVRLIRRRWGEGVTGLVGIGTWTVFAIVPVAILLGLGIVARREDANLGAALIALAVGGFFGVGALARAVDQVFIVALYRYATGSPETGGFAEADLAGPVTRRKD